MQLKSLIEELQKLYDSYDDEYKMVMGEPEIMIDVFSKNPNHVAGEFNYAGFSNRITIEKTDDGVYDVLCAFADRYPREE